MDFRLPELGEGVYEAELVAWQVKVGDRVKRGQNLMEVLTDKATMEVPAPFTGTISVLNANPGQVVKVGQPILAYDSPSASGNDTATPGRGDTETRRRADAETSGRRDGENDSSFASESHQSVPASPCPLVPVSPQPRVPVSSQPRVAASPQPRVAAAQFAAAPSVRLMARKLGVDLATIRGSGPGGRILVEDLSSQVQTTAPKTEAQQPALDFGRPGTRIKLQGIRRKTAEHMVHSKRTIPHYGYVDECDVSELVRLRQSLRDDFAAAGAKLTYVAFFVKAAAQALAEVPIVNASLDENAGEFVLHDHYHIGVAAATPAGLIVPVIHDADRKDLFTIAQEIERLSVAARSGKVRLEDLRGGTFTITSIGGIGGLISTPVIHHPNVAILGLGKVVKRPVYDAGGNLRPADLLYLSFSFDHRVVDGAVGAAFGNAIVRRIQNPARLLLQEKLG